LAAIDEMRPGSLKKKFKDPKLQQGLLPAELLNRSGEAELSMSRAMSTRHPAQIGNYKRSKALTAERTELSIEQSGLKIKSASSCSSTSVKCFAAVL
jgi:hypothetical protein